MLRSSGISIPLCAFFFADLSWRSIFFEGGLLLENWGKAVVGDGFLVAMSWHLVW